MGRISFGYFIDLDKYYCWYCDKVKNISEFVKDKSNSRGFKSRCKECYNEYVRDWRGKNIDEYNRYIRNRYDREYRKEYYMKNREKLIEYSKKYTEKKKKKMNE